MLSCSLSYNRMNKFEKNTLAFLRVNLKSIDPYLPLHNMNRNVNVKEINRLQQSNVSIQLCVNTRCLIFRNTKLIYTR